MAVSDDTDRTQAVYLKHLSPSWVRQIDAKAGAVQAENGGYFEMQARFEGKSKPRWYDVIVRYLPFKGTTQ